MSTFVIEDEIHAERVGRFASRDLAMAELRRLAALPYDEAPNVAPCISWATCRREYYIIEFQTAEPEWKETRRDRLLTVSAAGASWVSDA